MSNKLMHRVRSLVERGERIGGSDCRDLFEMKDLIAIARLARIPRERRFGRDAFYHAAQVADYRGEHPEFFISEMETGAPAEAVELAIRCHVAPGETPEVWRERLREFSRASRRVVALFPAASIARLGASGASYREVLGILGESCPIRITGEGGELFDPALRASHAPSAIGSREWLAVHAAAHGLGMKTQASMAYGTVDHPEAYASHLEAIRSLQEETGGFDAFVPMAMLNHGVSEFYLAAPTAAQSLRTTAIARVFLDNIPHIVAVPSLITLEIAVVALSYGADVIDTSIATSDVGSAEPLAGTAPASGTVAPLPVLDEIPAPAVVGTPLGKVRSRLEEARWSPIAVDASFAPAVAVVA